MRVGPDAPERLDDADRALVEQIESGYRPDPLTPNQRAELRLAIEERAERARFGWPLPALGGLAAGMAAVALAFALFPQGSGAPVPERSTAPIAVARADAEIDWVGEVFASDALAEDDLGERLPDEYGLIAMYFLDER